jgi:hypothetical protein
MAGTALLPWERWLAKLLHPLYVAVRRWMFKKGRREDLVRSQRWPEIEGNIHEIQWDSSLPREGLLYAYSCEAGYYSGFYWHWFERTNISEVKVGDRINLRYNPENAEESVFIGFQESPLLSVVKGF